MDKKVTIKYFLNTDLSPAVYYTEEGKELNLFPLYVRVTYNRQSTRFKFSPSIHIQEDADIEEFFRGRNIEFLTVDKEVLIERLIRYEVERLGKNFTLKGLGNRVSFYEIGVGDFMFSHEKESKDLDKFIEKSRLNHLLSGNILDTTVKLGIAASLLGKEKFNKKFPNLIKTFIVSGHIYNTNNSHTTIFDWLIRNVKSDVIKYLQRIKSKTLLDFNPDVSKEAIMNNMDEKYKDIVNEIFDSSELNIRVNSVNILLDNVDVNFSDEDVLNELDKKIKMEQSKIYKQMFK